RGGLHQRRGLRPARHQRGQPAGPAASRAGGAARRAGGLPDHGGGRMNCDELVELVTAYLDGALDPTTEQRFVRHLVECDGCVTYVEQLRRTVTELGHLPAPRLAPE